MAGTVVTAGQETDSPMSTADVPPGTPPAAYPVLPAPAASEAAALSAKLLRHLLKSAAATLQPTGVQQPVEPPAAALQAWLRHILSAPAALAATGALLSALQPDPVALLQTLLRELKVDATLPAATALAALATLTAMLAGPLHSSPQAKGGVAALALLPSPLFATAGSSLRQSYLSATVAVLHRASHAGALVGQEEVVTRAVDALWPLTQTVFLTDLMACHREKVVGVPNIPEGSDGFDAIVAAYVALLQVRLPLPPIASSCGLAAFAPRAAYAGRTTSPVDAGRASFAGTSDQHAGVQQHLCAGSLAAGCRHGGHTAGRSG